MTCFMNFFLNFFVLSNIYDFCLIAKSEEEKTLLFYKYLKGNPDFLFRKHYNRFQTSGKQGS